MVQKSKPRVLLVWELGTGLGHLSKLRLPIEVALDLGYEVFLAARELNRIADVLGDLPVALLQAPFKQNVVSADQSQFLSYTHLLRQQCFSSVCELAGYVSAWRSVFDLVAPDLVFFEHSPSALVAALQYRFKKVLLGTGFSVPPAVPGNHEPFAVFPTTTLTTGVLEQLLHDDAEMVSVVKEVMTRFGCRPICALPEIYAQADATFLSTLPDLDVFGPRLGPHYLGVQPLEGKTLPRWPPSAGAKVFGYLRLFPGLAHFLRDLLAVDVCAVLYVENIPQALRQEFEGEKIRFLDELIDLNLVATQAAWVVHHANHGTMATFLSSGVAQLLIPTHQEQLFGALRLVARGCAALAFQDQMAYGSAVSAMQRKDGLSVSARAASDGILRFDREANYKYMRDICVAFRNTVGS